jgi:hypothetical protein
LRKRSERHKDRSFRSFGRCVSLEQGDVLALDVGAGTHQVSAQQSGLSGCAAATTKAGFGGNESRVTVSDGTGDVVGTGTFDLSPGLVKGVDTCDWTAVVRDVSTDADFDTFNTGNDLGTVSRSELEREDWEAWLAIDLNASAMARHTNSHRGVARPDRRLYGSLVARWQ